MSDLSVFTVMADGPIQCKGAVHIGEDEHEEVYLCRCGQSSNKPFCDGTHNGAFTDPGVLASDETADEDLTVSTLEVTPVKNGPLIVRGPYRLAGADGEVVASGTKCALCRCGQSANKPFCDGAHKGAGFTTE